jgi:hypothetical protein
MAYAWAEHKRCAVAILNVGRVDGNAQVVVKCETHTKALPAY